MAHRTWLFRSYMVEVVRMETKERLLRIKNNTKRYKGRKDDFDAIYQNNQALDIIIRKGVAVGFIQLLIDENAGGVNEYNSYIGIKELFLTNREYNLIRKLIIYEKNQRNNFRRSEENL